MFSVCNNMFLSFFDNYNHLIKIDCNKILEILIWHADT